VRLITVAAHRTALTIQCSKEVWSPPTALSDGSDALPNTVSGPFSLSYLH
jgi:hypothetical protein